MIHLDTNFLIRAIVPGSPQDAQLQAWLAAGEVTAIDAIVWAEFLCGPVNQAQVAAVQSLVPKIEPFLASDSVQAAALFNSTGRRRGTFTDCMIAAIALRVGAAVATSNVSDFKPFEALGLKVIPV